MLEHQYSWFSGIFFATIYTYKEKLWIMCEGIHSFPKQFWVVCKQTTGCSNLFIHYVARPSPWHVGSDLNAILCCVVWISSGSLVSPAAWSRSIHAVSSPSVDKVIECRGEPTSASVSWSILWVSFNSQMRAWVEISNPAVNMAMRSVVTFFLFRFFWW